MCVMRSPGDRARNSNGSSLFSRNAETRVPERRRERFCRGKQQISNVEDNRVGPPEELDLTHVRPGDLACLLERSSPPASKVVTVSRSSLRMRTNRHLD